MSIADEVRSALDNFEFQSDRSKQSRAGKLGPSDIGFCRQKAVLTSKGTERTDTVSHWAAQLGTAVHNYVENAIHKSYPQWELGSVHGIRVTATLPSGAEISGHPDIVISEKRTVIDIKTVNGFSWVKRAGVSNSHKYQRHLYALGLIQERGWDPAEVKVGNLYMDRSGGDDQFILQVEDFDPALTREIDDWVEDVIYAIRQGEDAMRDIAAPVCERICEFFTVCRGGLETSDEETYNEDGLVKAVRAYVDARDAEKQAKALKTAAQHRLQGVNGTVDKWQVRWTEMNNQHGSLRLDVRESR
jgi:hypothetical protein